MLFNSLQFLIFFPCVVLLYWLLPNKFRNIFLLIASYYFYMNWEPVYALLIFFSTITTWGGTLLIEKSCDKQRRKILMIITLILNLSILFTFKYLGFVGNELRHLMEILNIEIHIPKFELLLPVGISFYTFQAVGYLIDVWKGNLHAEKNLFTYALFVSFFPQLVAGPIERAKNLLPQFHVKHILNTDNLIRGIELMVIGYFMKLCIADAVAPYVDAVYNNLPHHSGNSVLLATFFFTFQIFCDFGGYSLIAIGSALCMGFSLMQNFRQPYLATSVKDFWRRWHISLSTWFSDYVYIPLGGNRVSRSRHMGNLLTTFLVSGIWHGANYTFIAWGAYHGILQCLNASISKSNKGKDNSNNIFNNTLRIIITFILIMFGWIFFRANSINDAFLAYHKIFTEGGPIFYGDGKASLILPIILIVLLMSIEIYHEYKDIRISSINSISNNRLVKSIFLITALSVIILLTAQFHGGQFIYFQF